MKTVRNISLTEHDRQAISEAVRSLQEQFAVEHVILFGSKARGDDDEYSDMDLLLIASDEIDWQEKKTIVDVLFEIGMKYDVLFSFIWVPRHDWNGGIFTEFPIYQEILRDGVQVA